jgi:hypothetical protein
MIKDNPEKAKVRNAVIAADACFRKGEISFGTPAIAEGAVMD